MNGNLTRMELVTQLYRLEARVEAAQKNGQRQEATKGRGWSGGA